MQIEKLKVNKINNYNIDAAQYNLCNFLQLDSLFNYMIITGQNFPRIFDRISFDYQTR